MLGMAPKVAEGPGESRGMNGGLLQGLEVLLKGVVCVNRTTNSKSNHSFWFVDGEAVVVVDWKRKLIDRWRWQVLAGVGHALFGTKALHNNPVPNNFHFFSSLPSTSDQTSSRSAQATKTSSRLLWFPCDSDFESVVLKFMLLFSSGRSPTVDTPPHRIRLWVDPPKQQRLWVGCSGFLAIRT